MSPSDDTVRCRVAAVQMVSTASVDANLAVADRLLSEAADAGAGLVVLPENFACMPMRERGRRDVAEPPGAGPIQGFLASMAERHGVWIVAGTIPLDVPHDDRPAAACLILDDKGAVRARYDKIYLFDVSLPAGGESYAESAHASPGRSTVLVDTPAGRLGPAVCYDIRFPELFREMLDQGLQTIALPAAFTATTGAAHWETLLRARAIENQCWVIAAAQGGHHENGRQTHGDSMIVDPWGRVLERRSTGPGIVTADVDLHVQARIRARFPALDHRRRSRPGDNGVEQHG